MKRVGRSFTGSTTKKVLPFASELWARRRPYGPIEVKPEAMFGFMSCALEDGHRSVRQSSGLLQETI